MTKFRIQYEIEAYDMNEALQIGHTVLFVQNIEATNVHVEPVTTDPGRSFADIVAAPTSEQSQEKRSWPFAGNKT